MTFMPLTLNFIREKTYFAKLALIQFRWSDRLVIIDPLNLDLSVLSKIFHSNSVAVFHAGSQDLEILHRAAGAVPRSIFDTQIAAGFLGMRTPSLSSLHENLLGVKLTKGDRLTDWLQRPLKESFNMLLRMLGTFLNCIKCLQNDS